VEQGARRADVLLGEGAALGGRGVLLAFAAIITTIAQLTDPGTALDLLIVAPALATFVFQDRLTRLPIEVVTLLVLAPIVVVVGVREVLEPTCSSA
jgi:hypothetical protein